MELFLDKECLSLKEEEDRVERLQGLMKEKISKKAEGFFIDFTRKIAVKGEIATVGVWSLVRHTQYPYVPI